MSKKWKNGDLRLTQEGHMITGVAIGVIINILWALLLVIGGDYDTQFFAVFAVLMGWGGVFFCAHNPMLKKWTWKRWLLLTSSGMFSWAYWFIAFTIKAMGDIGIRDVMFEVIGEEKPKRETRDIDDEIFEQVFDSRSDIERFKDEVEERRDAILNNRK